MGSAGNRRTSYTAKDRLFPRGRRSHGDTINFREPGTSPAFSWVREALGFIELTGPVTTKG